MIVEHIPTKAEIETNWGKRQNQLWGRGTQGKAMGERNELRTKFNAMCKEVLELPHFVC